MIKPGTGKEKENRVEELEKGRKNQKREVKKGRE